MKSHPFYLWSSRFVQNCVICYQIATFYIDIFLNIIPKKLLCQRTCCICFILMNSSLQVSWEYLSGSVLAASVKVPYFWDWMINLMNDSNLNLFTTHSDPYLLSFISICCLYNEWPQFFFEIGRDVDWSEVLEVLSWRVLGARPQVGVGRFFKDLIHPHVDQYRKSR